MRFAYFNGLIDEHYPPGAAVHGRMHNKRMLLLLPRLVAFFQANPVFVPVKFHDTLSQIDSTNPPEAWLLVFAMRARGRWQDGTYIDQGRGESIAQTSMEVCWWKLRQLGYSAAVAPTLARAIMECEWQDQESKTLLGFLLKMAVMLETLRDSREKTVDISWFPAWQYAKTAIQKSQLQAYILDHYAYIARTQGFYCVSIVDGERQLVKAPLSELTQADKHYFWYQNTHFRCSQATLDDMNRQAELRQALPVDDHGSAIKAAKSRNKFPDGSIHLETLCKELQPLGYTALFSAQQTWSWVLSVMMKHLNKERRSACKVLRSYNPQFPILADDRGHTKAVNSLPYPRRDHNPDFYFPDLHISASSTMATGPITECAHSMLSPEHDEWRPIQHMATSRAFQEKHFVQPLIAAGWCEETAHMCAYELVHIMQKAGLPPQKALQVFFVHKDDPIVEMVTVAEPYGWLSPEDTEDPKALWDIIANADVNQQFRVNVSLPALPMVRVYGPARQHFLDLKVQVIACLERWHLYAVRPPKVADLPLLRRMLLVKDLQNPELNAARQVFLQHHICHIRLGEDDATIEAYQAAITGYFEAILARAEYLEPADIISFLRSGDVYYCPEELKSSIMAKLASEMNLLMIPHEFMPYLALINQFDVIKAILDRYLLLIPNAASIGFSGVTFTPQDFKPTVSRLLKLADKPQQISWEDLARYVAPSENLTKWMLAVIQCHFPLQDLSVQEVFLRYLPREQATPLFTQCLSQATQELPPGMAIER